MKKLSAKMLTILGMAAIVFASSCKKDDETKPDATITFAADSPQRNNSSVTPCDSIITFKFTANDPERRMRALRIMRGSSPVIPSSATTTRGALTINRGTGAITTDDNQTLLATVSFTPESNSGSYTYTIQVLDNTDASRATVIGSINVTITVRAVSTYSNRSLGAQTASEGSYFGATTGMVYTSTQANSNVSNVDFLFNFAGGTANSPCTATPTFNTGQFRLLSWAARTCELFGYGTTPPSGARRCYFRESSLSVDQFNNITYCEINNLTVSDRDPQHIVISQGGVYEFLTQDGKKGLVHVSSISGTGLNATATINVKVIE